MKIGIISNGYYWLPTEPGPSRFFEIAAAFVRAGHEVEVITTDFQHFEKQYRDAVGIEKAGYPYKIRLIHSPSYKKNIDPKRLYSNSVTAKGVIAYLNHLAANTVKPYDAIYCSIPSNRVAARVAVWCQMHDVPFVVDIEDLWPEAMSMIVPGGKAAAKAASGLLKPLERDAEIAYANASAVVGTSDDYTMRAFKNRAQDIPYRTVFVGCDLQAFDAGVSEYSGEVTKPEDEYWVTYAGSIGTSYDIGTLVRAGKTLMEKSLAGKRICVKILGDGPQKEEAESLAKETGADNVSFLGYTAYPKMAAYLTASDLTVNMFVKGAPQSIVNKVGDYLAAGRPVVNTLENPVFTGMVDSYGFGRNVEPGDPDALAECILTLLNDPETRRQMGEKARALAEERFDRKTAYQEIVRVTELAAGMAGDTSFDPSADNGGESEVPENEDIQ